MINHMFILLIAISVLNMLVMLLIVRYLLGDHDKKKRFLNLVPAYVLSLMSGILAASLILKLDEFSRDEIGYSDYGHPSCIEQQCSNHERRSAEFNFNLIWDLHCNYTCAHERSECKNTYEAQHAINRANNPKPEFWCCKCSSYWCNNNNAYCTDSELNYVIHDFNFLKQEVSQDASTKKYLQVGSGA